MKKLLLFLFVLIITSCSKENYLHELVERKGVSYLVNSQTPFNGRVVRYHTNGELQLEVNFVEGKRESVKTYYPNSQLEDLGNYVNGKEEGLWKSFHENGYLSGEGFYENGEKQGWWSEYHQYDGRLYEKVFYVKGESDIWETYHSNGEVYERGRYEGIRRSGLWVEFDEDGNKIRIYNWDTKEVVFDKR
jgi:antitoxin component YwqK of YwqJK toxin-antitoxin module